MAKGDFYPVRGYDARPTATEYATDAGTSDIEAGDWVKLDSTQGYVTVCADGDSNAATWVGIAASDSTHTASADGVVRVFDNPAYVFRGKPTTPANLAVSILNTFVTLDVDGDGVQTVDENDTTNGALLVLDFDNSVSGEETIDVQMSQANQVTQGS